MEGIEEIIYNNTREVINLEDKLSIATLFIFCYKHSSELFSRLLYEDDISLLIQSLNNDFKEYEVDFSLKLSDKNVLNSFNRVRESVRKKHDPEGYYKALFEGDEFAKVISEIVNYNFDEVKIKRTLSNIKQLQLF